MLTTLDCIPCFVRQMVQIIRIFTKDPIKQQEYLRKILCRISTLDFTLSPPALSLDLYRILKEETGNADPYFSMKKEHNQLLLSVYPMLETFVRSSSDPFIAGLNMSIAGNIIDFGAGSTPETSEILASLFHSLQQSIYGDIESFHQAVSSASNIMYLCDNAGEIVLDKLFIQQLPLKKVTAAVRGGPAINDATMEDALQVGLTDIVSVISNGSDAPGTLIEDCSNEFNQALASADCIIAKGQGNFESLNQHNLPIFFLFKVKCEPIARITGQPVGTHMLIRSQN